MAEVASATDAASTSASASASASVEVAAAACGRCGRPATRRCPKCTELGVTGHVFCSQECFKAAWDTHKAVHAEALARKLLADAAAAAPGRTARIPKSFEGYRFTGTLRPAIVSPRMSVPPGITKPDYADTGRPASEEAVRGSNIIPVYRTDEEIAALRKAGRLAREVLDLAAAALRPGVTGEELDHIVFNACMERGVYPSTLNYLGFPKSLCVSPNEVICHGIPDSRPIEDGDIVNLDVTVFTPEGFHADHNETYFIGAVDARSTKLVRCAYECLAAAVAVVKPGVMYRDLGSVITRVAGTYGFSVVKSYCGHGVGKLFHCAPNVPHYAKNKAVGVMRAGHVFTIEPMINDGGPGDEQWPDGWTVVTLDGRRSAQFEHTLMVTDDGCEILTARRTQVEGAAADAPVTVMPAWDEKDVQRPLRP